ncbi:hypothetical protein NNO07_19040 [Pseudomonas resinovorans]|uniref:Bacteriophage tail tape measure C-terminal domain-containing protein n=1 Tax=Metapseudomonas resinovorans TaxID=53412 RepID=A0ABT4Y8G3_METRE|nr:phage tail tape measure protein [Pseudomonas resinovorans]MDA8485168.1 hypothetical protein [Pseudomonas resinovorans]
MAGRSLGTLTLDLVAKIGGYVAGLDKAARESEKWRNKVKEDMATAGKALGAFSVVAAGALSVWVKNSIDAADEASKAAVAAGVQIEALTGLQYAAELAGVSNDDLNSSLARLNKTIDQASRGSKKQALAFADIGVSVRDASGDLKSADQVLLEIADRFESYEDGAAKAALAQDLFGKSGTKLIPLLNSGSAGIRELTDQAQRLGLVLDQETAAAAEEFNDSLSVLSKVSVGFSNELAADLLPSLNDLTGLMIDLATDSDAASTSANVLAGVLKGLATVGIVIGASFKATGDAIGAVASALMSAAQGDFKAAWDTLKEGSTDYAATAEAAIARISKLWSGDYRQAGEEAVDTNNKLKETIERTTVAEDGQTRATSAATDAIAAQVAALELQAATLGMSTTEATLYKLSLDGATEAQLESARTALEAADAYEKGQEDLKARAELLERVAEIEKGVWSEASKELDAYQAKVETLREALMAGEISEERYDRDMGALDGQLASAKDANEETTTAISAAWEGAAKNIQGAIADFLFDPFQDGLDGMLKNFGTILQRMLAEAAAAQLAETIFGAAVGGRGDGWIGSLAGLFGGGRANGGPVSAGTLYEVGEFNRPEIFTSGGREYMIPGNNGRVSPMTGGGNTVNISLPGMTKAREAREASATIQRAVARGVASTGRYT